MSWPYWIMVATMFTCLLVASDRLGAQVPTIVREEPVGHIGNAAVYELGAQCYVLEWPGPMGKLMYAVACR